MKYKKIEQPVILPKRLRKLLKAISDLEGFEVKSPDYIIEKHWARFQFHVNTKKGRGIATIDVMTTNL